MHHASIRQSATYEKKNLMLMTKIINKFVITAITKENTDAVRIVSAI